MVLAPANPDAYKHYFVLYLVGGEIERSTIDLIYQWCYMSAMSKGTHVDRH